MQAIIAISIPEVKKMVITTTMMMAVILYGVLGIISPISYWCDWRRRGGQWSTTKGDAAR
jgi:hypothetical protein